MIQGIELDEYINYKKGAGATPTDRRRVPIRAGGMGNADTVHPVNGG